MSSDAHTPRHATILIGSKGQASFSSHDPSVLTQQSLEGILSLKISLRHHPPGVSELANPLRSVIPPTANILMSVSELEHSLAMSLTSLELPCVRCSIAVAELSLAVELTLFPLTLVDITWGRNQHKNNNIELLQFEQHSYKHKQWSDGQFCVLNHHYHC